MELSLTKKLKAAMSYMGVNQTLLAHRVGISQPTLSDKMVSDNFKIKDYARLIEALGCSLELHILLPDGTRL